MSESCIIDDLIILGRAVPEPMKNGRVTVCMGGYSRKLGFARIYPTKPSTPVHRWDIVKIPVERDPRDTRVESWKIQGSKNEWDKLDEKVRVTSHLRREDRLNLIANLTDGCVKDINDQKRSLGIIKPTIEECYFCSEEDFDPTLQATLFGPPLPTTKKQHRKYPKVRYRCPECRTKNCHDQTVLEWGFYEWMRKNPDSIGQVWENARFNSPKHQLYFFVGNMRDRRTAFLVISTLPLPKAPITKPFFPLRKWVGQS